MRKGYWSQLLSIVLLLVVVAAVFFLVWRFYDSLLGTNRNPPPDMQVEDIMQSLSDMLEGEMRARYQELESRLASLRDLLAAGNLQPAQRDQYTSELKTLELKLMETRAELEQIQLQSIPGEMQRTFDASAADAGQEAAGVTEPPEPDGELQAAQERIQRLSEANTKQEERIRRLSTLNAQQEARAEQLAGGNARLEQRIGSLEQQIVVLQEEIVSRREQITVLQGEVAVGKEEIAQLEAAAGAETSRSAEVSDQAEQRVQELEDRIDGLQQQLAELRNSSQAASQQLSLADAENRILYERSDINGLFYTGPEGIRVSLNPNRRARVLEVGTYNVFTSSADGRRQSTRVLIFKEAGEIRFRAYPGFRQPQAGEWF